MSENERCENCKFFFIDVVDGFETGCCRRFAPRILHGSGTGYSSQRFPVVGVNEWCGEYDRKPPEVSE